MIQRDLTVAILAGGDSKRYGSDKTFALFQGTPLISYMVRIAKKLTENVLIVLSSEDQRAGVEDIVGDAEIVTDPEGSDRSSLNGAVTAFEYSETEYTLLLPVDTPLANVDLLLSLIQLRDGHGAVIPSWPNGNIEPLHGVYKSEHAYTHGLEILKTEKRRLKAMLDSMTNVLYVSTEVLKHYDPELLTFENINTLNDHKTTESKKPKS
ncbi:MAG: molybdenum cofactor guanylyltransferase [Candidatus Thorarchaeota archaeon]